MDITGPIRHPCPRSQRGAASVAMAFLILLILATALATALSMSWSAVRDAAMSEEQIAALYLAESGLERAQGILAPAVLNDTNTDQTCTNIGPVGATPFSFPAGSTTSSFRYTALTPSPSSCGSSGNPACTSCTIQVVGTARGASRTLNLKVGTTAASGGAAGCGGGGEAGSCPFLGNGVINPDWNPHIVQTIEVKTTPAILLSNMAFLRHPGGGGNVNATGCVAIAGPVSATCRTQWNDQSSSGTPAVGSRGAGAKILAAGSYTLTQNLDAHSLFAAVSVLFSPASGGTLDITGSYWNDEYSPGTTDNNSTPPSGQTNNGAACHPLASDSAACPAPPTSPPTLIPNSGSSQTSRSWCYGADTLVFGFSGRSSKDNNGALTSFRFGTAPESAQVLHGTVAYPTLPGFSSQLYSALRYIYNPDYLSNSNASSGEVRGAIGATVMGSIGADVSKASITSGTDVLTVSTMASPPGYIQVGDKISVTGCNASFGLVGKTIKSQTSGTPGGTGTYTLHSNASGSGNCPNKNVTFTSSKLTVTAVATLPGGGALESGATLTGTEMTDLTITYGIGSGAGTGTLGWYTLGTPDRFVLAATAITTKSTTLTVTSVTNGLLYNGDAIYLSGGSNPLATITSADGGTGTHSLTGAAQYLAPNTALKTTTVTLASAGTPTLGTGTMVAVRSGVGKFQDATTVSAVRSLTRFVVSKPPTTSLSGTAQVCGGICAFFNHDPNENDGKTDFIIAIPGTEQWAAGMTCLKGVDPNPKNIVGLKGKAAKTKAPWHESVF